MGRPGDNTKAKRHLDELYDRKPNYAIQDAFRRMMLIIKISPFILLLLKYRSNYEISEIYWKPASDHWLRIFKGKYVEISTPVFKGERSRQKDASRCGYFSIPAGGKIKWKIAKGIVKGSEIIKPELFQFLHQKGSYAPLQIRSRPFLFVLLLVSDECEP